MKSIHPFRLLVPLGIALAIAHVSAEAAPNANAAPAAVAADANAKPDTAAGSAYAGTHPYGPVTPAMEKPDPDTLVTIPGAKARRPNPKHEVVLVPPLPPTYPPSKPQQPIARR